jgi:hypothetical protein
MNKLNVFLDLDNTIIYSEIPKDREFFALVNQYDHDIIEPFVTVARPYLQLLLDFLFKNCNVNIWTAGSSSYASNIYEKFMKKYGKERQIGLILYSDHVDMSTRIKGGHKDLSMLWDYWKIPGYIRENTIIIDDHDEVKEIQPDRCIHIKPFNIYDGLNDVEMISIIPLIKDYIRECCV